LNHLRALYAGEVTLVDRWVGMLLQKIEDLGLFENTAVIFTTDHGTYLGEHGYVGKRDRLYGEVAHIPLMARMPDSEGNLRGRCGAIVQSPDLMASILDIAGVQTPHTVQGRSILPFLRCEDTQESEIAVSSPTLITRILPSWITVTSKEWAFLAARNNASAEAESELYDLSKDPTETHNVCDEEAYVAERLRSKMIEFLRSMGTKDEILRNWAPETIRKD